jgi:signal transduction histidine kinase
MRSSLPGRSTVATLLVLPLLAVAVLAGLGTTAGLEARGRAQRVLDLVPFAGALTTLVHGLQQERALSDGRLGGRAEVTGRGWAALPAVRGAVDRTAAAYRDAAVRLDLSDRDRQLRQRLDDGLARLAELGQLRSSVDRSPAGGGTATTAFRRYTTVIGALLAVDSQVGLRAAGEDAELLRAVTASAWFSRAKELADRERGIADRAASLGRLDPSERTRIAATAGRHDALLDQFRAFAGPGQLELYDRAIAGAEAERADRLRRSALESASRSGSAAVDLAGWSSATAARVERMRGVELGLSAELARLAGRAVRAADRRALAHGAGLLLACCFAAVLWLLAPRPARRAGPRKAREERNLPEVAMGRSEAGLGGTPGRPQPAAAAPPALPGPAPVVTGPWPAQGLVDLARRGQELVDQQLELLGQAGRDQADPRLPGRLLQLDRLAGRARRNAYNLIVLAGGEPARRWDRPVPMAEVVGTAVRENKDAPRVDVLVPDDLLVPEPAADDLVSLLGELVDNATAFSAPETRVRVSGQQTGSGYVVEVEDRGLGMTGEELDQVNRRLAARPVADVELEQRLGTWVAGRLAERHDVKVRLRPSAFGGVTALVFLPERLTMARPAAPPVDRRGPPDGRAPQGDGPGGDQAAALTRLPVWRHPTQGPEATDQLLPRRAPNQSLAPDLAATQAMGQPDDWPEPRRTVRSPEEVRSMLSRYRSGLERGRAAARDQPAADPEG